MEIKPSSKVLTIGGALFAFSMAALVFSSLFYTVDAGEKAIVLKFGKVTDVVDSGLHFKVPMVENIIKMSTRVQKMDVHGEAASKDLQSVVTTLTVNVMVRPDKVAQIYQTLKTDYEISIVAPVLQEIFKSVTAQYNAEELITKRELVRTQIFDRAKQKLATYNLVLDNVSITNFAFSRGYSEAIEQKQIAEQNSKKAEYDYQRIEVEAKQTVARAQAEAQALSLQRNAVTDQLVQLRKIEVEKLAVEKWDGHLPTTTGGAMPFLNISK
ncbi:MAG: prohibitin family protein [Sulfuricurvum sp.]|jgi:regulator of protease activity HflC (stomatin/prohibitin superfamily)